jgi:molybdopterin synthase sulfur carrier subunit
MKYSILYFASLRDAAGCESEQVVATTTDARSLYEELRLRHAFALAADRLRVVVNGEFANWNHVLADGDEIAFLPPVSGG